MPIVVSTGLATAALVHPRETYAAAISRRAVSIVLVHNHPSGDPTPSPEDIRITKGILAAGRIIDIPLLDHVIVTSSTGYRPTPESPYMSLRESGLIDFD